MLNKLRDGREEEGTLCFWFQRRGKMQKGKSSKDFFKALGLRPPTCFLSGTTESSVIIQ